MVTEQQYRALVQRWTDALQAGDWGAFDRAMDETVTSDYVFHLEGRTVRGAEGVRRLYRSILPGVPDDQGTIEDVFVAGARGPPVSPGDARIERPVRRSPSQASRSATCGAASLPKTGSLPGRGRMKDRQRAPIMNRRDGDGPSRYSQKASMTKGEDAMSTETNKATLRRWLEAWNTRDVSVMEKLADEIYTNDFVSHDGIGFGPDLEGVKQFARRTLKTNPDGVVTVEDLIAEDDKVVARFTVRGTDASSGKPMHLLLITICRFAGGKIGEVWQLAAPVESQA